MKEDDTEIDYRIPQSKCFKDITGKEFGHLKVRKFAYKKNGRMYWDCDCRRCGGATTVSLSNLLGKVRNCYACGRAKTKAALQEHGMARSKFYRVWSNMVARCKYPSHVAFKNYGGRGIKVCERWKKFSNFMQDTFSTYKEGLCIERVNNNGDYEPSNYTWATREEENNNRRNTIVLVINGEEKTLSRWARHYGMDYLKLYRRIKQGMSPELAIL